MMRMNRVAATLLGLAAVVFLWSPGAGADDIRPFQAQEVKPYRAQEVQRRSAHEVQRYQSGVDPVTKPDPLDSRIVGRWQIKVPGGAWSTRTYDGPNVVDTTRVGLGAGLGLLTINPNGTYSWVNHGKTLASGRLAQVTPRSDAKPGWTYWLLSNGSEQFCVSWDAETTGGRFLLTSPRTHHYAAEGQRAR
jgi:hypothetical protein